MNSHEKNVWKIIYKNIDRRNCSQYFKMHINKKSYVKICSLHLKLIRRKSIALFTIWRIKIDFNNLSFYVKRLKKAIKVKTVEERIGDRYIIIKDR